MNQHAPIGHNHGPSLDPIDAALEPYGDTISESENWLDGEPVENEGQMQAIDALLKDLRTATTDLDKAKKAAVKPLHDAWKAEIARWKPTEDDLDRRKKGLAALVDPFKRRLAAEKEAAKRAAYEEARRAEREAEERARAADVTNLEAQREADAAKAASIAAKKVASAANRDTVKGMRTVTRYEVADHRALLHWIAANRRDDLTAFIDEWARKNHRAEPDAAGLRVWEEKAAY